MMRPMRAIISLFAAFVLGATLLSCASVAPSVAESAAQDAASEQSRAEDSSAPTQVQPAPSWSPIERQTVELSFIALAGCWHTEPAKVCDAVTSLLGEMLPSQEIIWGPAVHQPRPDFPDSESKLTDALAFIVRDRDTGVFSVVFRGTNTVSATEWVLQDFMVKNQVPWLKVQAGPAPADALVSEGTATAVTLRRELRPGKGEKGEGTSLEDELLGILEDSSARCSMRFTGHSLGGLLAPVMALWFVDRLDDTHREDLAAKLDLEVYGYAAPTAGNGAFATYLESRLRMNRRYASPLDAAPMAWDESSMASLPDIYLPSIRMRPFTKSFYDLCRSLARDKGYAQPGEGIAVPSRIVPTRGDRYLLEAAYQHASPYLNMLSPERKQAIVERVLDPLAESISVVGFKPADIEELYNLKP